MINFLIKAKRAVVGAVRKRKAGTFKKVGPHNWQMLHEIVHKKQQSLGGQVDIHPNMDEAKLMHTAAKKLTSHLAGKHGKFSPREAHRFLDEHFGHLGYRRFGLWKQATIDSVEKYMKELAALNEGGADVRNTSDQFHAIKDWHRFLEQQGSLLKTDVERDALVSAKFASRKKKIAHILFICRDIIGPTTPLSMVPQTGFKGFCKSIIEKVYEHGPEGLSKEQLGVWNKAFDSMFARAGAQKLLPLPRALAQAHTKPFFKANPKWFVYCCTRTAAQNDGVVNLSDIERYMKNAIKFHGTKNPPQFDYDDPTGSTRARVRGYMVGGKTEAKDPRVKFYRKLKRSGR